MDGLADHPVWGMRSDAERYRVLIVRVGVGMTPF